MTQPTTLAAGLRSLLTSAAELGYIAAGLGIPHDQAMHDVSQGPEADRLIAAIGPAIRTQAIAEQATATREDAGPTPRPWPAGVMPTAAQLLGWVRVALNDEVLTMLDSMLEDAQTADRCRMSDHDRGLEELNRALVDATRWRILRDHYRAIIDNHDLITLVGDKATTLLEQDDTP